MTYVKNTWQTGDTITAEKLNHMEQGIEDAEGGGGNVPSPSSVTPSPLGTAAVGTSTAYARADHVHAMPTASDVGAYTKPSGGIPKTDLASAVQTSLGKADGAIPAPSSPASGAFLVWNGTAWVAQTLSTWSGGNY